MGSHQSYRLREAAKLVGVSTITLRRWLLQGKVREVARDRNGWRVFTANDVRRIRAFANLRQPPVS